jgi:hypothetical protein
MGSTLGIMYKVHTCLARWSHACFEAQAAAATAGATDAATAQVSEAACRLEHVYLHACLILESSRYMLICACKCLKAQHAAISLLQEHRTM